MLSVRPCAGSREFQAVMRSCITGTDSLVQHPALTSEIHLVGWSPVSFLLALVAGDGNVFKRAPVLLVAFKC